MAKHETEASTTGVHNPARQSGTGLTIIFSVLGIGLFVGFFYWYNSMRHVSGSVKSTSAVFGEWTMHPDSCRLLPGGDGVLISDAGSPRLSAIVSTDRDTGGAAVQLASTVDGKIHELERDRCGVADMQIHPGEDGKSMSGNLSFNCVADGGVVSADVEFRNCS